MMNYRRSHLRTGMALVIVLVFMMSLMILGSSYIKSVSNITKVNPNRIRQVQGEFFAHGLQKIAIMKFKNLPSDFYHAYIHDVAYNNDPTGMQAYDPTPIEVFHGHDNPDATVLQKWNSTDPNTLLAGTNVEIASYSTNFRLTSQNQYNRDVLEITVSVDIDGKVHRYLTTVNASRSRRL